MDTQRAPASFIVWFAVEQQATIVYSWFEHCASVNRLNALILSFTLTTLLMERAVNE